MAQSNVTRRRVLDNVRPRIVATVDDPALLDDAFAAFRQWGPSYGYTSAQDWWDTQVRTYPELFDGTYGEPIERPEWVSALQVSADTGEVSDEEQAALAFLASYTGSFEFLTDLKRRAITEGRTLSERQVAAVLRCKAQGEQRATPDSRQAEARKELDRLNLEGRLNEFTTSLSRQVEAGRTLSPRQLDALLNRRERRTEQRGPAVTEDGMYRTADGTIYKVQVAVNGSGRLYAKKLVPPSEYGTRARFVYESGAINRLRPEDRMTLEQAREFGALYGTCCVCGRTLTDETSIANGIGPVCEGRGRWA